MAARYRISEPTFIRADHTAEAWLYSTGDEIEFSGTKFRLGVPLNDEAEAALAAIGPLTEFSKNILPRRGDRAT
jgi:hypothetical protein